MWCVADVVRQSHNPDFVGMEVKFILHLEQDSDGHLSGNGRKALVNGALPPPGEIWLALSSGVLSIKILWSALSIQPQPVRAEIPGLGEDDVDRSGHHRCRTIELPQTLSEWLESGVGWWIAYLDACYVVKRAR
jgi:hypothetical protein